MEVDYVIGADGANSRVAKAIDAGEYNYAIAFQERIKVGQTTQIFPSDWIFHNEFNNYRYQTRR